MPPSTDRPYRLGVLFVHGIGNQRPGETLVRWGDALVGVLAQATGNKAVATVDNARIGDLDAGDVTQARVTIRSEGATPEPWLITESWSGRCGFPAPSYSELVSWGLRALPWSIAFYFALRYWQTSRQSTWTKISSAPLAVLQLAVALLIAPVLLLFLAIGLILGALPIPQLRSWILAAQSTLTATVGDTLAFVESPLRAALIRGRVLARLAWLKPQCDRTIVIAHSSRVPPRCSTHSARFAFRVSLATAATRSPFPTRS